MASLVEKWRLVEEKWSVESEVVKGCLVPVESVKSERGRGRGRICHCVRQRTVKLWNGALTVR